MLGLPYATHRYLIEPLTGEQHIMKVLVSRFLGFMDKIASSQKKFFWLLAFRNAKRRDHVTIGSGNIFRLRKDSAWNTVEFVSMITGEILQLVFQRGLKHPIADLGVLQVAHFCGNFPNLVTEGLKLSACLRRMQ
jgi:hypothetical protein